MANKTYRITLTPLDWYFFGGEKTFGEGNDSEYLAKSNLFPQQTALLGAIRYQILKRNGRLAEAGSKISYSDPFISSLIGEKSFSINEKTSDFGVIKSITPLCIAEKDTLYYPAGFSSRYNVRFSGNTRVSLNGNIKDAVAESDEFDPKKYTGDVLWISKSGGNSRTESDFFNFKEQIGITKTTGQASDKDAFYKKQSVRLKEECSFVFWAELDDHCGLNDDVIYLGAERSCFSMKISETENTSAYDQYMEQYPGNDSENSIILLSDTHIEDKDAFDNLCLFHWSDTVPFRNLITTETGKLSNGFVKTKKSTIRYNLLKHGSVLYFKPEDRKSIEKILKLGYMQIIGFNYFR